MTWVGWVWIKASWKRVAEGQSLAECSRRLSTAAGKLRLPDSRCTMTGGGAPSFTPAGLPPRQRRKGRRRDGSTGEGYLDGL